jgi:ribosomal protein S18 acetylase RimI-like enzyme
MNFYSDEIIRDIMDNAPLETMIDQLRGFVAQYEYLVVKYSYGIILDKYLTNLLNDSQKFVVAFHCLDNVFDISNCPSLLIYRKCRISDETSYRNGDRESGVSGTYGEERSSETYHYYVLLTCTKRQFRGNGYAKALLNGLVARIQKDMGTDSGPTKILLSSVEDAVLFYEAYGFRWTRESISTHPVLMEYEAYDEAKEYFVMEYVVRPNNLQL